VTDAETVGWIVFTLAIVVYVVAALARFYRRRGCVWVATNAAPMFEVGEICKCAGTSGPPVYGRVVAVTRSALLVKPLPPLPPIKEI
jgi:hypothetical protein